MDSTGGHCKPCPVHWISPTAFAIMALAAAVAAVGVVGVSAALRRRGVRAVASVAAAASADSQHLKHGVLVLPYNNEVVPGFQHCEEVYHSCKAVEEKLTIWLQPPTTPDTDNLSRY